MKKTIFTITAIGILGVLACSNKKDPEPTSKSKTELLTAHEWKLDYSIDSNGDTIRPTQECDKDNRAVFGIDNSYKVKLYTKCDSNDFGVTGTWAFFDNENKIILNKNINNQIKSDTVQILILDENIFEMKAKNVSSRMIK